MYETQKIDTIEKSALIDTVNKLQADGYRFMQVSCTKTDDGFVLDYTFDLDGKFYGIRVVLTDGDVSLPSISSIYLAAFLYENELHDLFGLNIQGIAVDFKGKFYRIEQKTPFSVDDIDLVTKKE